MLRVAVRPAGAAAAASATLPRLFAHNVTAAAVAPMAPLAAPAARAFASISGMDARVCAVLGSQWGDEGKGKLADVLAAKYDVVARFNGGANAGHTVVVDDKKFAFHLLPCGLVYPHTQNLIGNGTVIDLKAVFDELDPLTKAGIDWNGRLKISDRAHLLFEFHKIVDGLQESQRGSKGIGTTRKGIGPAYSSKATRNGLRVGQLRHWDMFKARFRATVEAHQKMYDFQYDIEGDLEKCRYYAELAKPMIVDGVFYLNDAYRNGKRIIAEGANACMLDLDFGTYPYVTSSTTTAGGLCTGLGLSPDKLDCVVGVVKAYTTRVGAGPFVTELTDERGGGARPHGAPGTEIGLHLQKVGAEIGVTTGRKRRCGWFDAPVVQYSHMINNFTSLNLTKLDVMDELDEVRICTGYKLNGELLPAGTMPSTLEELARIEPVYETLPGWKTSIAACQTYQELPAKARAYIERIEQLIGVPISWIGVGPGRHSMVRKGF